MSFGKFFDFLTPANFLFIRRPLNRQNDVPKGRYTGFALLVQIVDTGATVEDAMRCPATRRLLAPEILAGQARTANSASWSLYRMYYDSLTSKNHGAYKPRMQLIQTSVGRALTSKNFVRALPEHMCSGHSTLACLPLSPLLDWPDQHDHSWMESPINLTRANESKGLGHASADALGKIGRL